MGADDEALIADVDAGDGAEDVPDWLEGFFDKLVFEEDFGRFVFAAGPVFFDFRDAARPVVGGLLAATFEGFEEMAGIVPGLRELVGERVMGCEAGTYQWKGGDLEDSGGVFNVKTVGTVGTRPAGG